MRNPWRSVLFAAAVHLFFVIANYNCTSATITECNEGSLRSAVAGGGTVTLACDGTIVLSQPLVIDRDTVIDASGHSVILSGGDAVRVFVVSSNVSLTLGGLEISHGRAETGGAILNDGGTVNIVGCVFAQNNALGTNGIPASGGHGGAILNRMGTLTATSCTFSNNQASGGAGVQSFLTSSCGGAASGGAILNDYGQISFTNCQFVSNSALGGHGANASSGSAGCGGNGSGGAIASTGGTVDLVACSLAGNRVVGGNSGVSNLGSTGGFAVGGAIDVTQGQVFISLCNFQTNAATGGTGARLAPGGLASGGAFHCGSAVVNLADSSFVNNHASAGYGVNESPTLSAAGRGGAMFASGTATVSRVLFATNSALGATASYRIGSGPGGLGEGGALYNAGLMHILSSSFVGNACQGGPGAVKEPNLPPQPVFGSGGDGQGGGIDNAGTMRLLNCTLAYNHSRGGTAAGSGGSPGTGHGGGFFNTGLLELVHVTVSGNVTDIGGGLWSNGQCAVTNSIIAINYQSNCFGAIVDGGHNLSSDTSCHFAAAGSQNNVNPLLGALDYYGGPTPAFILGITSPAIDAANDAASSSIDQRAIARPVGARCDIGATEVRQAEAAALISVGDLTAEAIQIRVIGHPGLQYRLLSSSSIQTWTPEATSVTDPNGRAVFTIPRATGREFYKLVTP
jgi:hypothetical protein